MSDAVCVADGISVSVGQTVSVGVDRGSSATKTDTGEGVGVGVVVEHPAINPLATIRMNRICRVPMFALIAV